MASATHPQQLPSTAEAYVHLRGLPGMPSTLPEALSVPHWSQALRATAVALLVQRQHTNHQRPSVQAPAGPLSTGVPMPRRAPSPSFKAAAAGDND